MIYSVTFIYCKLRFRKNAGNGNDARLSDHCIKAFKCVFLQAFVTIWLSADLISFNTG